MIKKIGMFLLISMCATFLVAAQNEYEQGTSGTLTRDTTSYVDAATIYFADWSFMTVSIKNTGSSSNDLNFKIYRYPVNGGTIYYEYPGATALSDGDMANVNINNAYSSIVVKVACTVDDSTVTYIIDWIMKEK
ncbi:MAG: hypothetical protein H8D22_03930 [Candidatus Cloacimonetes bacterium]|nr:hypothetical protein [Candidatus Cloacimonadota bacterium]